MASKKDDTASTEQSWLDEFKDMAEEEFKKLYPLTHALVRAWDKAVEPVLRVISTVAGFRRGGLTHTTEPTLYDLKDLHPEKIEQILAEPALTAELVEKPAEPEADVDTQTSQA
ncbi:hypothetical protein RvVAT039_04320 [Agrobacterium vitis]|uniref:Uncharacterized protein n=2 Tax=Rhizobium/Agrobacterium group TaxID=227290 RepID=B9JYD3_ALLAM|nr:MULTISPECIES: hypothetical protein [Rhizobium/Agrobacterium group]ACM37163.1 hypothetical protein Avi_3000 [Allorhizobium ampelinum S4]MUO30004.1 hypothetical protein [Agrobacterium vitis]MUO42368.1 hypothetical protein [Agrobacterium vitis]MUP10718.1 hypothetical protein [Agrobacterium vitis]BCH63216.1 hypothetical protein RvVAT039_04320 [Agrobacterium vitis]